MGSYQEVHKVLLWKQKGPTAIRVDGTCPTLYHKITNGSTASVRNGRCFSYALREAAQMIALIGMIVIMTAINQALEDM